MQQPSGDGVLLDEDADEGNEPDDEFVQTADEDIDVSGRFLWLKVWLYNYSVLATFTSTLVA